MTGPGAQQALKKFWLCLQRQSLTGDKHVEKNLSLAITEEKLCESPRALGPTCTLPPLHLLGHGLGLFHGAPGISLSAAGRQLLHLPWPLPGISYS